MNTPILEIKEIILKELYENGFEKVYKNDLTSLLQEYNLNQIKRAVLELHNNGLIHVFGIQTIDHVITQFIGYLTDHGILEYENYDFKDNKKFSIEIARFIYVVDQTEQEYLKLNDIIQGVISLGSDRSKEDLEKLYSLTIKYTCDVEKAWPLGTTIPIVINVFHIHKAITEYGKIVLQKYYQHTQFFKKTFLLNRDLLFQEFNSLQDLIESRNWKDACIKIGSLLEYLLTKWLEHKKIPIINPSNRKGVKTLEDVRFVEKIAYYIKTGCSAFSSEIGSITEWNIVDSVIRDYRNYIHLQKYEERVSSLGPLTKSDYDLLYPTFNKIIGYF